METVFIIFILAYISIYVAADAQNIVFGNVLDKGRWLIIGDNDVYFITDIILGWIFSILFSDFNAHEQRSIHTPLMMALINFFHANADMNVYHY